MTIPDSTADLLLVIALAGVGLLTIVCALLALRLARLRRSTSAALGDGRHGDVIEAVRDAAEDVASLRKDLGVVHGNTEHLRELLRRSVSRVGIIRYDAFEDMGGAQSFSAALLDERGNGVVISAINGRQETRTYAKPIVGGDSDFSLSTEEAAAIDQALRGELGVGTLSATPGGRRRRRNAS